MKFAVLVAILVTVLAIPAIAGYEITTTVEEFPDSYRYTWSVYNENMDFGLDGIFIEAPIQTRVLASLPPLPYGGVSGEYWEYIETEESAISPLGEIVRAPSHGQKWLEFWGHMEASIYPPGSTASFSITTDKVTVPGQTTFSCVTYHGYPNYSSLYYTAIGPTAPVPEPNSLLALGAGIATLTTLKRRRRG